VASVTFALAAVTVGGGVLTAQASPRAKVSGATSLAPVGTLSVGKATKVYPRKVQNIKSPAFPRHAFFNRPTVSMSQYRAAKVAGNHSPTAVRPNAPKAPRATNLGGSNGITQATAQSSWPPDINGSVSGHAIAEIVNQHLTAFTRGPTSQYFDRSLASLTGYSTQSIFDPRLLFDTTWHRWIWTAEAFPESAGVQQFFLAVSTQPSDFPDRPYFIYQFNINGACGSGNFYDYPQVGFNQDGIVFTGNCFAGNTYTGARVVAVAKALLYNGLGFSTPIFSVPTADSTTTPSIVVDQFPHMDMLSRNGPHIVRLNNTSAGFYASLSDLGAVTGFFAPSTPRSAGQAGCTSASCNLDTSDGRFVAPGIEFSNQLWNVADYGLSGNGTFATPTWGEFNRDTLATVQSGQVFRDGCSDDFNPSLTASPNGNAWINWTSTDPQGSVCGGTFVRQEFATRVTADTAGTFPSRVETFVSPAELTGNFDPNFGTQRWGDTSSISLDPHFAGQDVALSWNESVPNNNNWGTRTQFVRDP
jgi:hypothetical protein